MNTNSTCADCKHFSVASSTCRINPPTAFVAGINDDMKPLIVTCFPQVEKTSWCGKHEIKLNVLASPH